MTIEALKKKLEEAEQQFEIVQGNLYRLDGIRQFLKQQIAEAENPPKETDKST